MTCGMYHVSYRVSHASCLLAQEEDQDFIYLALERCAGSLSDLIDTQMHGVDHHAVLHHMMTGLTHLHKLNIVHRVSVRMWMWMDGGAEMGKCVCTYLRM